jgi:hypothetical protein
MSRQLTAFVALFLAAAAAQAVEVRRTPTPIRVDAVLDEPAWQEATPIPVAYEWEPGENVPAAAATEALVTYDDGKLYVAFRAHDPHPENIRARFNERDLALSDDNVGFLIDPFNDERRAYQFRINPLGVQADAINSDVEGTEDFSWDAIWDSAGRLTPDGYVVEVAVPLQQLRIPSGSAPQTWGFMAMRDWPRDVRHRFRSVITDQNRNCLICLFQDVSGFGATRTGRNIEVTPTLTGTVGDEGGGSDARQLEPGVSGRWAITSGTSLQATLNPDFSQVEADAAELDVNTRFALSFPEKRPFFLEGADFFETQLPLVFTRTIADPVAGVKLTGKSGSDAFGVLLARDRITNFLVPSDQSSFRTSIPSDSTTAIFRYRHEMGKKLTAGALVTSRTGPDYSNQVAAGDSFLRLTEQDSLRVQLAGSRADYPRGIAAGSMSGHAFRTRYSHNDRNWSWGGTLLQISPGFRADAGLIDQVGVRAVSASAQRRIRGSEKTWFRNLYFGLGVDGTQEYNRAWNEWGADVTATYQGPHETEIDVNFFAPNQEYFAGRVYHNTRHNVSASYQATRDVGLGMFVNWGESIDFTNERKADFITVGPSAEVNVGRNLRGELSWQRQTFRTEEGQRIFTVDVPQTRLLYHFNRRAFVRAILQYRDLDRVPAQYRETVDARSRSLLSQLLFSYRLDAQTVLLVGYSDHYSGTDQADLSRTNRALFLKVGYAWLF